MKYYYVIIILLPKYKKDIYSLVILIFLNHLIFIGMIIYILLLILCLLKIIIFFKYFIDNDLLIGEKYDYINTDIQKFSESINIGTDINSTNNIKNIEKNSSSWFSTGLIIKIIIPSVVVIIDLFTVAILCGRVNTPFNRNNLLKKSNDFSSSEINMVANSGN